MDNYTEYDISVGIASAITAYSRVILSQHKILLDNQRYYTENETAIMEKPLPP